MNVHSKRGIVFWLDTVHYITKIPAISTRQEWATRMLKREETSPFIKGLVLAVGSACTGPALFRDCRFLVMQEKKMLRGYEIFGMKQAARHTLFLPGLGEHLGPGLGCLGFRHLVPALSCWFDPVICFQGGTRGRAHDLAVFKIILAVFKILVSGGTFPRSGLLRSSGPKARKCIP
jgi:hypothetical protein